MSLTRIGSAAAVLVSALFLLHPRATSQSAHTLPASLANAQFWALIERFSEPDGYFRSNSGSPDNLLSNERELSIVAAALGERVQPDGVYLGVGPEQNFTYIAAMRPRIALITDIRRGNLHLHLLYKAIFETTSSRAEFVGRLFSRKQPARLSPAASIDELMAAYLRAAPDDEPTVAANLAAITGHLTRTRALPLEAGDLAGVEYVYRQFHRFGPTIHYTASIGRSRSAATYIDLMIATDNDGVARSYLSSDERFGIIKAMQQKNLIVPVVGDFAGPKALRAIAAYLKEHGARVSAFYVSNVESYLQRNGVWSTFCGNVAALPLDPDSVFIRPGHGRSRMLPSMLFETASCRMG
jgi:hypothetical protein